MATVNDLMGVGTPGPVANLLGFGPEAASLTGAGTTATDALQLTAGINIFGTVASGSGAKLPSDPAVGMVGVINGGANALLMYPQTGGQINNGTVTTGTYSVANGKTALFIRNGNRWLATLST